MKVGIIGATGAVGRQMLVCLQERNIECEEVRLFASARSVGKEIPFGSRMLKVQEVSEEGLKGLDCVLGAVSASLSKEYLPLIQKSGAVYIDNSSAFRQDPSIPLVVPEINGEDALHHHGIIANPNCSTAIALMAAAPIHAIAPIQSIRACTYQAVSGAGMSGMEELRQETEDLAAGRPVHPSVFPAQIAYNVIADIGSMTDNGYTTEEMKMQNEGRKILHAPQLNVTCTCVRVPVYRSHSISLMIECDRKVSVEEAEKAVASFSGVKLMKDRVPDPLTASDQDLVLVGRIRRDLVSENGLCLWCCGDQIRKGAAGNAVQILQYLIEHDCVRISR